MIKRGSKKRSKFGVNSREYRSCSLVENEKKNQDSEGKKEIMYCNKGKE